MIEFMLECWDSGGVIHAGECVTVEAVIADYRDGRDGFWDNFASDPNAFRPGYVVAVDGSWVPSSFYGGRAKHEDQPGWDCATQGNRVCGPGQGPNDTDHNVYYGYGKLPVIPGRVTTFP